MEIEIYTAYDEVVIKLLQEAGLLSRSLYSKKIYNPIMLPNDEQIFEWREWMSAAMVCGLIEGGRVR